jgi:hypothetical protein
MSGALIVNADDLGASRGATLGIVRAHREGIVTSASLFVASPAYEHALECIASCPDLGIGLHFTLTAGKAAAGPRRVPLLVGEDGFFRRQFVSLLCAATGPGRGPFLEQVEIELEAQLQRMLAAGLRPDHINSERHVHLIPGVFERVVAAARRHDVRFVRLGRDLATGLLDLRDLPPLLLSGGFVKLGLLSLLSRRNAAWLDDRTRSTEFLASYLYTGRVDLLLPRILDRSRHTGLTEIMVHPGVPEESRGLNLGNREFERYLASKDRGREMQACIEARAQAGNWKLTNFARAARESGGAG